MNEKAQEFETQELGWWVEILTNKPSYIYYFGAFNNYWEAEWHRSGYIQDLEGEGAEIVNIEIEKCQPKQLTIPVKAISI